MTEPRRMTRIQWHCPRCNDVFANEELCAKHIPSCHVTQGEGIAALAGKLVHVHAPDGDALGRVKGPSKVPCFIEGRFVDFGQESVLVKDFVYTTSVTRIEEVSESEAVEILRANMDRIGRAVLSKALQSTGAE